MDTLTPAVQRHASARRTPAVLARIGIRRYSAIEFLIVLAIWIVSTSFLTRVPYGDLIEAVLSTLVFLSAVLSVGGRRRTLIVAILLVAPAFVGKWLNHCRPELVSAAFFRAAAMLFIAFIAVHLLSFVLRAPQVDSEVLCAAVSVYLLSGVVWAFAYMLVAELIPGSFVISVGPADHPMVGFEALYFSFVTLSTVGYGDIVPASAPARMLAIMEATVGMLYVSLLIARLVAIYSPRGDATLETRKGDSSDAQR